MPNHVTNVLTVDGPVELVKQVRAYILDEEGAMDFNVLAPMPALLSKIQEAPCTIDGKVVERWVKGDDGTPRELSAVEEILIKTCGGGWYGWALANWGTKWNAYEQTLNEEVMPITDKTGYTTYRLNLKYTFQTAWAMPEMWLEKLCARVPAGVSLGLQWADEDFGSNTGLATKTAEGFYGVTAYPDDTVLARDHAAGVLGHDPREDEDWEEEDPAWEADRAASFEDTTPDTPKEPTGPHTKFDVPFDWEGKLYN